MNREEKNRKLREYRLKNGNACTKKYEKTRKGFLMRCYRNMQSRVNGVQKAKFHLYEGKELLERDLFYKWSLYDNQFNILFDYWTLNCYDRKLTPSVDRIDSSKGYSLDNMEWITNSENSSRGAKSRFSKK